MTEGISFTHIAEHKKPLFQRIFSALGKLACLVALHNWRRSGGEGHVSSNVTDHRYNCQREDCYATKTIVKIRS